MEIPRPNIRMGIVGTNTPVNPITVKLNRAKSYLSIKELDSKQKQWKNMHTSVNTVGTCVLHKEKEKS